MQTFKAISDIRKARHKDPIQSWGLVPTMGYLHEGHLSLIRKARQQNDRIGVSIFINPIQFNNSKDLMTYPQNLEEDLSLLEKENVDLVWIPSDDLVYPSDFQTYIDVTKITSRLEGAARPGHFKGVTTVVAKLFNVFQPHRVYFGKKDFQQLAVIKQMVKDLNFNIQIIPCPIIRENDGLAMSSRNSNLSAEARKQAVCLYQALTAAKNAVSAGEKNCNTLKTIIADIIQTAKTSKIDYISIADPDSLEELDVLQKKGLFSMAVYMDKIRLIDNMEVYL